MLSRSVLRDSSTLPSRMSGILISALQRLMISLDTSRQGPLQTTDVGDTGPETEEEEEVQEEEEEEKEKEDVEEEGEEEEEEEEGQDHEEEEEEGQDHEDEVEEEEEDDEEGASAHRCTMYRSR